MATIIISRSNEYLNRMREYDVYLDGEKVGSIANGETKEFDVSPGTHTILTKIDWYSSPGLSLEIMDEETKSLQVGGFKNGRWMMPAALILIVHSYILNLLYDFDYLIYLAIPIFLLLVYYLSLGRGRYLALTEVKPGAETAVGGEATGR